MCTHTHAHTYAHAHAHIDEMVIILRNGFGKPNSNPGQGCLCFISY